MHFILASHSLQRRSVELPFYLASLQKLNVPQPSLPFYQSIDRYFRPMESSIRFCPNGIVIPIHCNRNHAIRTQSGKKVAGKQPVMVQQKLKHKAQPSEYEQNHMP